jgi:hypothetical protein
MALQGETAAALANRLLERVRRNSGLPAQQAPERSRVAAPALNEQCRRLALRHLDGWRHAIARKVAGNRDARITLTAEFRGFGPSATESDVYSDERPPSSDEKHFRQAQARNFSEAPQVDARAIFALRPAEREDYAKALAGALGPSFSVYLSQSVYRVRSGDGGAEQFVVSWRSPAPARARPAAR